MTFHNIIQTSVGADLSRPIADSSALGGCSSILMKKRSLKERRRTFMHTPRAIKSFLAIGWFVLLVLLLTACATRDLPAVTSGQMIHIPLGTTLLTPQSASSVFTVSWSPDGNRIASVDDQVRVWQAS
jgi:hypothetical protein